MKEADLAITEVLEKAATPGPWHRFEAEGYNLIGYEPGYEAQIRLGTFPVGQGLADLRFVIHARDAVPVLVAEVRRLRAIAIEALARRKHDDDCWPSEGRHTDVGRDLRQQLAELRHDAGIDHPSGACHICASQSPESL